MAKDMGALGPQHRCTSPRSCTDAHFQSTGAPPLLQRRRATSPGSGISHLASCACQGPRPQETVATVPPSLIVSHAGPRQAACLHGGASCSGAAWEGGSCPQRPPIFNPIYFNKINLRKEGTPAGFISTELPAGPSGSSWYSLWFPPRTTQLNVFACLFVEMGAPCVAQVHRKD